MKNLIANNDLAGRIFSYLPSRIRNIAYYRFLQNINFPEIVHIENTNACNAQCIMCPHKKMTRTIGTMDFELFKKIIDECALYPQLREVHLHGFGECLLERGFCRKVAYAKKKGIKATYIVTNGSLLTEATDRELITAGLDKIKISFYGATSVTYEKVHVNLEFDRVVNNVLALFAIRKQLKRRNPSIFLQFLPLEENRHEQGMFIQKWEGVIDKNNGDALLEYQLHNYGLGNKYNKVAGDGNDKKSCVLPFMTMQVLWNGDVVPCCFDYNGALILGNIKEQGLKDVWNNLAFARLRQAHRRLDFKTVPLCAQCDQIVKKTENSREQLVRENK